MGVGGCEMKTIGYTCRSVVLTVFGPGFNSRRLHHTTTAVRLTSSRTAVLFSEKPIDCQALLLQDLAPGWTQGERGIDQSDVGIGLGEIAKLEASMREKMFREEPDAIGGYHHLRHDLLSLGQAAEFHQRLDDPERANDEGGLRGAEIVWSQIAIEESYSLPTIIRHEFP